MGTLNGITFNYWLVSLLRASMTLQQQILFVWLNITTLQIEEQVQNMGHNKESQVIVFKKEPMLTIGLKTFG